MREKGGPTAMMGEVPRYPRETDMPRGRLRDNGASEVTMEMMERKNKVARHCEDGENGKAWREGRAMSLQQRGAWGAAQLRKAGSGAHRSGRAGRVPLEEAEEPGMAGAGGEGRVPWVEPASGGRWKVKNGIQAVDD